MKGGGGSNETPTLQAWFIRSLDQAERAAVLTVHDQWAASQLKAMHSVLSSPGLPGNVLFCSQGAAQHRGNLTYGEWEAIEQRATPAHHAGGPPFPMVVQSCRLHLITSQKVADATTKLEKLLRLCDGTDMYDTLTIPEYATDDKMAPEIFRVLMILARPEEREVQLYGRNVAEMQKLSLSGGMCHYFSLASYAASVLYASLLKHYRHHLQSAKIMRGNPSGFARPVPSKAQPASQVLFLKATSQLQAHSSDLTSRFNLEIKAAKLLLQHSSDSAVIASLQASDNDEDKAHTKGRSRRRPVEDDETLLRNLLVNPRRMAPKAARDGFDAWRRPTGLSYGESVLPVSDKLCAIDHFCELLPWKNLEYGSGGYGPVCSRWRTVFLCDAPGGAHFVAYCSFLDLLFSSPLAYVSMHNMLFGAASMRRATALQLIYGMMSKMPRCPSDDHPSPSPKRRSSQPHTPVGSSGQSAPICFPAPSLSGPYGAPGSQGNLPSPVGNAGAPRHHFPVMWPPTHDSSGRPRDGVRRLSQAEVHAATEGTDSGVPPHRGITLKVNVTQRGDGDGSGAGSTPNSATSPAEMWMHDSTGPLQQPSSQGSAGDLANSARQPHSHGSHTPQQQHSHVSHAPVQPHSYGAHTQAQPHSHGSHTPQQQHSHGLHTQAQPHSYGAHTQVQPHSHGSYTPPQPHSQGSAVAGQIPLQPRSGGMPPRTPDSRSGSGYGGYLGNSAVHGTGAVDANGMTVLARAGEHYSGGSHVQGAGVVDGMGRALVGEGGSRVPSADSAGKSPASPHVSAMGGAVAYAMLGVPGPSPPNRLRSVGSYPNLSKAITSPGGSSRGSEAPSELSSMDDSDSDDSMDSSTVTSSTPSGSQHNYPIRARTPKGTPAKKSNREANGISSPHAASPKRASVRAESRPKDGISSAVMGLFSHIAQSHVHDVHLKPSVEGGVYEASALEAKAFVERGPASTERSFEDEKPHGAHERSLEHAGGKSSNNHIAAAEESERSPGLSYYTSSHHSSPRHSVEGTFACASRGMSPVGSAEDAYHASDRTPDVSIEGTIASTDKSLDTSADVASLSHDRLHYGTYAESLSSPPERKQDEDGELPVVRSPVRSATEAASAASGVPFAASLNSCTPPIPPKHTLNGHSSLSFSSSASSRPPEAPRGPTPPRNTYGYNPLCPMGLEGEGDHRRHTAVKLHEEMVGFLAEVAPTELSTMQRQEIVDRVREAARICWSDAEVCVYGSFSTGLFLPHSDVDILVLNPNEGDPKLLVKDLAGKLAQFDWCANVLAIDTASVPVIKFEAKTCMLDCTKELSVSLPSSPSDDKDEADAHASAAKFLLEPPSPSRATFGHKHTIGSISVDVTFYVHDHEQLLSMGVGYAPLKSRDYVLTELEKYPEARPIILVLKQFFFRHGINDAYSGGLSSHSLILLVFFYVRHFAREPLSPELAYGELLLRMFHWLAEFPFAHVGIEMGMQEADPPLQYLARTEPGMKLLKHFEVSGGYNGNVLTKSSSDSVFLGPGIHVGDPLNPGINVAKASYKWEDVQKILKAAWRLLDEFKEASPHLRIFGGVSEKITPLSQIFDPIKIENELRSNQNVKPRQQLHNNTNKHHANVASSHSIKKSNSSGDMHVLGNNVMAVKNRPGTPDEQLQGAQRNANVSAGRQRKSHRSQSQDRTRLNTSREPASHAAMQGGGQAQAGARGGIN